MSKCQQSYSCTFKGCQTNFAIFQGTKNMGLRYLCQSLISPYGFKDANWADCPTTRWSATTYCVFLGANCVLWSSKKQSTVSWSSFEVEYLSITFTAAKITWLTFLLRDLDVSLSQPPLQLFCDIISLLHMPINLMCHARSYVVYIISQSSLATSHINSSLNFSGDTVINKTCITLLFQSHSFKLVSGQLVIRVMVTTSLMVLKGKVQPFTTLNEYAHPSI